MNDVRKIDITSSTIFRTILIIIAFLFLYVIRDVLVMILAAVVIASAIEPVAKFAQRYRVPRAITVLIVYIILLILLSGAVTLVLPPLTQQLGQLAQSLPHLIGNLGEWSGFIPSGSRESLVTASQSTLVKLSDNFANLGVSVFMQTKNIFSGFFSFLFVFIIAFYLVLQKDALKKVFRLIIPTEHAPYVELTIDRIQSKIGRLVAAQLALAAIVGVIDGLILWLLGVPYALALALFAGVLEIIPVIGPIIAAIPGVIIAMSMSWVLGLATLVMYVAVQQIENHVLIPNIMRRAIGLNPLVTLLAILLGARLAGVAGIILAIPAATILSILTADFFAAPAEEEELPG